MKRLCFLLLLLGCGDSTGPSSNPSDYLGSWTVAVDASAGCWNAFEMRFDLTSANVTGVDTFLQTVTQWWFPVSPGTRSTVIGQIYWSPVHFQLFFSYGPATLDGPTGDFVGTDVGRSTLRGVFDDRDGLFSGKTGCQGNAVATKH
jgi:hypothetical protein